MGARDERRSAVPGAAASGSGLASAVLFACIGAWSPACGASSGAPATAPTAPTAPSPGSHQDAAMTSPTSMSPDPLVARLAANAYGDPWNYAVRGQVIDAIWAEAGG